MAGQDYQQLRTFIKNAGFEFDLVANGQGPIHLDQKASCGNFSSGHGSLQGFYVCFDSQLADQITPGVAYSLRPNKTNGAYFWTVLPSVVLLKPAP